MALFSSGFFWGQICHTQRISSGPRSYSGWGPNSIKWFLKGKVEGPDRFDIGILYLHIWVPLFWYRDPLLNGYTPKKIGMGGGFRIGDRSKKFQSVSIEAGQFDQEVLCGSNCNRFLQSIGQKIASPFKKFVIFFVNDQFFSQKNIFIDKIF